MPPINKDAAEDRVLLFVLGLAPLEKNDPRSYTKVDE